jgi:hypothetical protein
MTYELVASVINDNWPLHGTSAVVRRWLVLLPSASSVAFSVAASLVCRSTTFFPPVAMVDTSFAFTDLLLLPLL